MAAPNLNSVTSILGKTARSNLNTTNVVGILTNSGGSNKVLKINSLYAANVSGSIGADVSIGLYNGITTSYIAYTINVPADATQIITSKDTYFYMEEGDELDAFASNADRISIIVGYEEIS